ncbi:MAG: hypothetical protein V1858_05540 [Candidatus Gottesmanbacteria bacterium]
MTPSLNENAEKNGTKPEALVGYGMVIKTGRTFGGQAVILETVEEDSHTVVIMKGKDKGTVLRHLNNADIYKPQEIIG